MFCDSITALAGYVRTLLATPRTVDELWADIDRDASQWPGRPPYDHLVYALDTLFALKQIVMLDDGRRIGLRRPQ
jgi:hypothetical protein